MRCSDPSPCVFKINDVTPSSVLNYLKMIHQQVQSWPHAWIPDGMMKWNLISLMIFIYVNLSLTSKTLSTEMRYGVFGAFCNINDSVKYENLSALVPTFGISTLVCRSDQNPHSQFLCQDDSGGPEIERDFIQHSNYVKKNYHQYCMPCHNITPVHTSHTMSLLMFWDNKYLNIIKSRNLILTCRDTPGTWAAGRNKGQPWLGSQSGPPPQLK